MVKFSDTERVLKALGDEAMKQEDVKFFSVSAQDIANQLRMPKKAAEVCLGRLEAAEKVEVAVSSPDTEWWLTEEGWKDYEKIKEQEIN